MKRRNLVLAFSVTAVLAVSGTIAMPAAAQARITVAPPAPLGETIPPGPNFNANWIPGYWQWNGRDYVWNGGHWEQAHPGMAYQQAYWTEHGGSWEFHPGGWITVDDAPAMPSTSYSSEIVTIEPPPPQIEVIPVAPGPSYIWISGVWLWGGGHYAWRPGYWTGARVGYAWAPAHWSPHGGGWRLSGGYWHHHR